MEIRYPLAPQHVAGMSTEDLRREFLVQDLFVDGRATLCYTHHDRIVLGGVVPAGGEVTLPNPPELSSDYFLENRELGVINVGATGVVRVDGEAHELVSGGCLYVGRGVREVVFADSSDDSASFYLFSAPAHTTYPTTLVAPDEGTVRELGDGLTSNRRTLRQYIHPDGVRSCQIMMGMTELHPGSMWNTMPAHTHDRRTECYLYFDLGEDARVVHLLGEVTETRHLIVADRQAVISPSWSVHSGVGTGSYSFVWAMAGENQRFDDMDPAPITSMR